MFLIFCEQAEVNKRPPSPIRAVRCFFLAVVMKFLNLGFKQLTFIL